LAVQLGLDPAADQVQPLGAIGYLLQLPDDHRAAQVVLPEAAQASPKRSRKMTSRLYSAASCKASLVCDTSVAIRMLWTLLGEMGASWTAGVPGGP
jgi:hypothetical protein